MYGLTDFGGEQVAFVLSYQSHHFDFNKWQQNVQRIYADGQKTIENVSQLVVSNELVN